MRQTDGQTDGRRTVTQIPRLIMQPVSLVWWELNDTVTNMFPSIKAIFKN